MKNIQRFYDKFKSEKENGFLSDIKDYYTENKDKIMSVFTAVFSEALDEYFKLYGNEIKCIILSLNRLELFAENKAVYTIRMYDKDLSELEADKQFVYEPDFLNTFISDYLNTLTKACNMSYPKVHRFYLKTIFSEFMEKINSYIAETGEQAFNYLAENDTIVQIPELAICIEEAFHQETKKKLSLLYLKVGG